METRTEILRAADSLFHEQGVEATSFSHIAQALGISRGNFYYHFKTKDEILDGVIGLRVARTEEMLAQWEREGASPRERLGLFIRILSRNRDPIMRHGCPLGTLTGELAKLNHPAREGAAGLFTLFRAWIRRQFERVGHGVAEADDLALHLLVLSQGVATLANAFHDEAFIEREVARAEAWLDAQCAETQTTITEHDECSRFS